MNSFDTNLDKNSANFVPLSPLSFISRVKDIYPNYESLIYGNRKYTWVETYNRCTKFASALTKQGIKFKMGSRVNKVKSSNSSVSINYTDLKSSKDETLEFDKVLVSVGRKPYTEGLNLTKIGVKKDNKGMLSYHLISLLHEGQ